MNKAFAIFLIALVGFMVCARGETPIDFSTSDNLKAVYDAGYRPWRSTLFRCEVTHKTVSFILPSNAQFTILAQIASFSVLSGDQMSRVELYGEVMSRDKAIAKIREVCGALNLTTSGLDQFASTYAGIAPTSTIWNSRGKKGDISIFVRIERINFIDHLGAQVYVNLDWKRGGIPPKFPTTPMQPPAGYENESMAPPPPTFNPNPHQPFRSPEEYKAMIDKIKAGGTPPSPVVPSKSAIPATPNPQVQPASKTAFPFWVYGTAFAILGLVVALWYRYRVKR